MNRVSDVTHSTAFYEMFILSSALFCHATIARTNCNHSGFPAVKRHTMADDDVKSGNLYPAESTGLVASFGT